MQCDDRLHKVTVRWVGSANRDEGYSGLVGRVGEHQLPVWTDGGVHQPGIGVLDNGELHSAAVEEPEESKEESSTEELPGAPDLDLLMGDDDSED